MQLSRWGFLYIHLLIQFHFRTSFSLSRVRWEATSFLSRFLTPNFNPPIPCGMGQSFSHSSHPHCRISIHPSRVGWDQSQRSFLRYRRTFQSTHPVWDGTSTKSCDDWYCTISIHPSRVGWDRAQPFRLPSARDFNPPIPCGMGPFQSTPPVLLFIFQSTHHVWDGT